MSYTVINAKLITDYFETSFEIPLLERKILALDHKESHFVILLNSRSEINWPSVVFDLVSLQALHDLTPVCSPYCSHTDKENFFNDQERLQLTIFFCILRTLIFDSAVML